MEIFDKTKTLVETLKRKTEIYCQGHEEIVDDYSTHLDTSRLLSCLTSSDDDALYKQAFADMFAVTLLNAAFNPGIAPFNTDYAPRHAPRFETIESDEDVKVGTIQFKLAKADLTKLPFSAAIGRINALHKDIFSGWRESYAPDAYEKKFHTTQEARTALSLLGYLAITYGLEEEWKAAHKEEKHSSRKITFQKPFLEKLVSLSGGELDLMQIH